MPLISQQILSLVNGVSQQADKQRASGQMQAQTNCFDSITFGKIKRPPTTHVAQLATGTWTTPYLHAVNRDATEKYHVVIQGGKCTVYDGNTGAPYSVLTPQGTSYLTLNPTTSYTELFQLGDSFHDTNGTLLSAHASDSGPGWTLLPGENPFAAGSVVSIDGATIQTNALDWVNDSTHSNKWSIYSYNQSPTVPDSSASVTIKSTGTVATCDTLIGLRVTAGTGATYPTGYFLRIPPPWSGGSNWTIYRYDAVTGATNIGSFTNPNSSWGTSVSHAVKLQIAGTTISCYNDGVLVGSTTDATYATAGLTVIGGRDQGPNINITAFSENYSGQITLPAPVQSGFRFCTVQDSTFIVNQTKTVEPLTGATTPVRYPEALITIALADYATNYYVTLNGITVGLQTPAPSSPGSRQQLGTDLIAQELYAALTSNATLNGAFSFTLLGQIGTTQGASTIYLTSKTQGQDFTISANDGLNDGGIVVVKGTVQNIAALPARALNGMVVKVQPDPQNNVAVAYYTYQNFGSPNLGGVWIECAAPGILTNLDPKTMPWILTKSGDVVSGFPADGPIPQPVISNGYGSATYYGPSGTHARGGIIGDNNSTLTWTFTTLGTSRVTFVWDVDAGALPATQFITLTITDVAAAISYPFVYAGGTSLQSVVETFNTTSPNGSNFTATLTYSTGGTPGTSGSPILTAAQQSSVAFHSNPVYNGGAGSFGNDVSGLNSSFVQVANSDIITFNSSWTYAGGVPIVVTIGGTPQTYTPAVDQTANQVATAVAALSFAGYTGTVLGNVATFTKASPPPGSCTVAFTWDNTKQYHSPGLQLAPNSLVGFLFQDLTDGSSAIVTSNSATTITFSSGLGGGTTNAVRANDIVAVTGLNNQIFFVLQPINWSFRPVGDDVTNPFPSFTFNTINEVGFTSGRLVFLSGENVTCSASNSVFQFFRSTVTQLLDADRIDIQANSDTVSQWHSIVHWAEGVWLFAGNVQAQLPTEPSLSNATVSIQPQTKYQSQPTLRPLAMDRRVFFARLRSPNSAQPVTEILRYQRIRFPFFGFIAETATKAIPTYIAGTPIALVGDPILEIMVALTSAVPNQLYPYIYHYDEQQQLQQESWSTWQIDPGASILAIDMLDGVLAMIVQRSDGVYLEYMDFQFALYEQAD